MENNEIHLGGKSHQNPSQSVPKEILDTEFQVPTIEVDLPSQGFFYGGKKTAKIKYLTAEEDDILFSPELIKSGKSLDVLLNHAVIDTEINPEDMLSGDRNYVLLALRRTGFGDIYDSDEKSCPSCSEEFKPKIDLSKLKLKKLEIQPDQNGEYDYIMPKMNIPIKFRFLTGKDEARLAKVSQAGAKKVAASTKVSKLMTEKYLLHIMEVNGRRDKLLIQKFISAIPTLDTTAFREYMKLVEPNIDLSYEFECPHCTHTFKDDVVLDFRLFYPSMK